MSDGSVSREAGGRNVPFSVPAWPVADPLSSEGRRRRCAPCNRFIRLCVRWEVLDYVEDLSFAIQPLADDPLLPGDRGGASVVVPSCNHHGRKEEWLAAGSSQQH